MSRLIRWMSLRQVAGMMGVSEERSWRSASTGGCRVTHRSIPRTNLLDPRSAKLLPKKSLCRPLFD